MRKIGVFDSGIGGLSVLQEAMTVLPGERFIYYADEAHVPYGEKTREEISGYVQEAVGFLLERQVDAIVIACNTATSVAAEALRKRYRLPIIGMEPAIKRAIDLYGDKKVLAAATPITVKGEKMRLLVEKVDKHHLVDLVALPGLVRFAENGNFETETVAGYLREALGERDWDEYSSLVLGCTHFNYFKDAFRRVLPETIHFVDGNAGTVAQLVRRLPEGQDTGAYSARDVEYYCSGKPCGAEERDRMERLLERLARMRAL